MSDEIYVPVEACDAPDLTTWACYACDFENPDPACAVCGGAGTVTVQV
jgi:hypothetical protein